MSTNKTRVEGAIPEIIAGTTSSLVYKITGYTYNVYVIRRDELYDIIESKEFYNNYIYFLVGNERSDIKPAYVGQAKISNNYDEQLLRIKQHDKSKTEKYRDDWKLAVVVMDNSTHFSAEDLNILEAEFHSRLGNSLNSLRPNVGKSDTIFKRDYKVLISLIQQLLDDCNINIFDVGAEVENESSQEKIEIRIVENNNVENLDPSKSIPEMVTPIKLVRQMVDLIPEEVLNNINSKYLDPACKGGEYLREIYDRLIELPVYKAEFPNEIERNNHILQNQLYGIAISDISRMRTTNKLLQYNKNIIKIDDYISKLRATVKNTAKNKNNTSLIDEIMKGFGENMKFDVVIGNPPYQEITGGAQGKQGAVAIYDLFILNAEKLGARYISMITPVSWYSTNSRLTKLREMMTNTNKLIVLHDFETAKDCFENVYIMGGVAYFLWDREYNGKCKIYKHRDGKTSYSERFMLEYGCDIFIRYNEAVNIILKVDLSNTFDKFVSAGTPFGLSTKEIGSVVRTGDYTVPTLFTSNNDKGGSVSWSDINDIRRGHSYIDKHKVFIPKASDNMLNFPYKVLGKTIYGPPGTVCTGSYMVVGPFNTEEECNNVSTYLKTKFARMLILQRKFNHIVSSETFRYLPVQDFSKPWTDEELYKKYNLTQEEIDFIEKTIAQL